MTGFHGGVSGSSEKGGSQCLGHQEGFPEERALERCVVMDTGCTSNDGDREGHSRRKEQREQRLKEAWLSNDERRELRQREEGAFTVLLEM